MKKEEIINILKTNKPFMEKNFGVKSIGLFGSVAAGKSTSNSDIDILVELKAPKYDWWAGLLNFLQEKLGHKVDLITKGTHLSSRFLNRVSKDLINV